MLLKELPSPAAQKVLEPLPLEYPSAAIVALANPLRIAGYDFARAVAILGMLVDHCIQVIGPREPDGWGHLLMRALDGRPSAVFVVLSGVGVTLLGRRNDAAGLRRTLFRRGAVLLGIGFINQAIWPGDILRLFGVALMAASVLTGLSSRWLLGFAVALVLAFPAMTLVVDYESNWDWHTMAYAGMWDPIVAAKATWRNGFSAAVLPTWSNVAVAAKNILYNGFRPAVPWAGLLVLGMWLGRVDTTRPGVRRRILFWGLALTGVVELVSRALMHYLLARPGGRYVGVIVDVLDTGSMPPHPPFVLSVAGVALTVIGLSLIVGVRFGQSRFVRAMVKTGQMALTCYILHILVGAAFVLTVGRNTIGSVGVGLLAGLALFALVAWVTLLWKRRWKYGPMEALLRSVG